FDAVVANPPFSYRWEPTDALKEDFRFKGYGMAPKSAADFAFLLHGFHFLHREGTMAIILPHGVLFRGGEEERYSRRVSMEEIEENGFNLNISRYVSTALPEPQIDLDEVFETLQTLKNKRAVAQERRNSYLKALGLPPLPE
ncbi:HsdM family class I SAM-dependent methyltransferase, partial [Thiolapillus sp.]|uniref:HsdM family class I SAM-dependent methyltransferase n=1 Tax=Thiolapillus sp. TaxID=2017437 RepID=UPI003AF75015